MRRAVFIAVPALIVLLAGAALWYRLSFHGDAMQTARQRMQDGDMPGAELYLRLAIRQHPDDAEAAFRLGEASLALGNPSGAELELRRAKAAGYDQNAIMLPLAQSMLQQHKLDEILREFDPATMPAGSRGQVLAVRASAQLAQKDLAGATATAKDAEAASPREPQVLLTAGRVAVARGDIDDARTHAEAILRIDPKQVDAMLLLNEVALLRGDAKTALAEADRALAESPKRLDAHLARARALAGLGRDTEARAAVEEVLRSGPKDIGANYLRTVLALRHNDFAAADASLGVLSPVIGALPQGLYFLAITKIGVGQPAQAEEAAIKYLAQAPKDQAAIRLMAYVDLARGRSRQALDLLTPLVGPGHAGPDVLTLYARAQAALGNIAGASATLGQAAALSPSDVSILNRLAALKLGQGDTGAAEGDLRRSLALQPAQPQAVDALVQGALSRGDLDAARAAVAPLRQAVGDTEAVGVMDAQIDAAGFQLEAAETRLRDVLKRFPDSRPATLNLVRVLGMRSEQEAGRATLEDWLHRHPDDGQALGLLLPELFAAGQTDLAVDFAEKAHAAAVGSPAITAALAATYVQAKTPARAVALLDRAGAQDDQMLEMARAEALGLDHKPKESQDAYRRLLDRAPGNDAARRGLAALLLASNDTDGARAVLRDGLRLAPGSAGLMDMLVGIDLKKGGADQAVATATSLQQAPGAMPAAAGLVGDTWRAAGQPAKAASSYQATLRTAPSALLAIRAASALAASGQAQEGYALLEHWFADHPADLVAEVQLANLDMEAKRLDSAEARLRAALTAQPANVGVLNNLAWTLQLKGDFTGALPLAKRAYVTAPSPEAADTLGWILSRQGDQAAALPFLAQANADQPADHGPGQDARRYHYAAALAASGKHDEAKGLLAQAVAGPDFDEKKDAQHLLDTLAH